jgi:hypothetical protein
VCIDLAAMLQLITEVVSAFLLLQGTILYLCPCSTVKSILRLGG